jgi:sugar phosphate isomerase/epimerase
MPPLPNPLLLFNNHFTGYRRHYSPRTRLAIAADLGYDGFEFHAPPPDDEPQWADMQHAFDASGLRVSGVYVIAKLPADTPATPEAEIERLRLTIERMASFRPRPHLTLAVRGELPRAEQISFNPMDEVGGAGYHEWGSARATEAEWVGTAALVREADKSLAEHGLAGTLYNHVAFVMDTPASELRVLEAAGARVIRPGIASIHTHFNKNVPDPLDWLALAGMERLAHVHLANGWAAVPQRTLPLDEGQIDIAGWLALLWSRGYAGPIAMHGFSLGGDPYVTAERSIRYVQDVWARLQRDPRLDPTQSA